QPLPDAEREAVRLPRAVRAAQPGVESGPKHASRRCQRALLRRPRAVHQGLGEASDLESPLDAEQRRSRLVRCLLITYRGAGTGVRQSLSNPRFFSPRRGLLMLNTLVPGELTAGRLRIATLVLLSSVVAWAGRALGGDHGVQPESGVTSIDVSVDGGTIHLLEA